LYATRDQTSKPSGTGSSRNGQWLDLSRPDASPTKDRWGRQHCNELELPRWLLAAALDGGEADATGALVPEGGDPGYLPGRG
jgi:hypothetical protein